MMGGAVTVLPPSVLVQKAKSIWPNVWEQCRNAGSFPLSATSNVRVDRNPWPDTSDLRAMLDYLDAETLSSSLWALYNWRFGQGVYRFDETLWDELACTEPPKSLPVSVFAGLPEWCPYVELPRPIQRESGAYVGFFVSFNAETEALESVWVDERGGNHSVFMFSSGYIPTGFSPDDVSGLSEETARSVTKDREFDRTLVACSAAACLYLCAANADIRGIGESRPCRTRAKKVKGGVKMFPSQSPTEWRVGWRIGPALRASAASVNRNRGTHATPRAHLRRAHWHHYWLGPLARTTRPQPTKRELVIKWIAPTLVNAFRPEDLVPVVREVAVQ